MTFKKIIVALMVFGAAMTSSGAFATKAFLLNTSITRVIMHDALFGQCMVLLSSNPADAGLDCPGGRYVTLDCGAELSGNTRSNAAKKLDAAMLAYVARKKVNVQIDDSKRINGYCYAFRLDLR